MACDWIYKVLTGFFAALTSYIRIHLSKNTYGVFAKKLHGLGSSDKILLLK